MTAELAVDLSIWLAVLVGAAAILILIGLTILDRLRQIASLLGELTVLERKRETGEGGTGGS